MASNTTRPSNVENEFRQKERSGRLRVTKPDIYIEDKRWVLLTSRRSLHVRLTFLFFFFSFFISYNLEGIRKDFTNKKINKGEGKPIKKKKALIQPKNIYYYYYLSNNDFIYTIKYTK